MNPEKLPKTYSTKLTIALLLIIAALGCNEADKTTKQNSNSLCKNLESQALDFVTKALDSTDPQIRSNAIEVVGETKRIELMPKVAALLKDDYVPVRFSAALAVADTKYALAKNKLIKLLRAPDQSSKLAAAYALAQLGDRSEYPLILNATKSLDQKTRANAVTLLAKSGNEKYITLLYSILKDPTSGEQVRFQAIQGIAMLKDEKIYPKLWALLISVYADDRVIGIEAMGALATEDAKNALITMLDDDVAEVRLAAAENLGKLGDYTGEAQVIQIFKEKLAQGLKNDDRTRLYLRAALAAGQIKTDAVREFLPELLNDQSQMVRLAAAKAVLNCAK